MKILRRIIILLPILCSVLSACHPKKALPLAEKNCPELKKVLLHYKLRPEDSLKYKAACFLIQNMPGHYSYSDTAYLNSYYHAIDSVALLYKNKKDEIKDRLFREITTRFSSPDQQIIEDTHTIKANYLIGHIDRAFQLWKKGEWAQHVNFDDFCEYLLPYKVCELQTLDNWREYLGDYGDTLALNRLKFCKLFQNSAYVACQIVNRSLRDSVHPRMINSDALPVRRMNTLLKVPYGVCDDYNLMAMALMRAHGIPVVMDYIPQWPFRSLGHSWDVLLETSGKRVVLEGGGPDPANPHKEDHPVAKVFRQTYARNLEIEDIFLKEKHVPETFATPFMKDVTGEYQATVDVGISAKNIKKHSYAYLSVFDNASWIPIHWGKLNKKKVCFHNMGKRVVYLPVLYENEGIKSFSDPILVLSTGKICQLKADTTQRQHIRLFRKYPPLEPIFDIGRRILGGKIQCSDDSLFSNSQTLFTIKDFGIRAREIDLRSQNKRARYWRYFPPNGAHCNIAEIFFYEVGSNKPIKGKIIGTSGSWRTDGRYAKEAVFDRDALTFFDAPRADSCWVGMDFGKQVKIDRIVYLPRNDGNCIEIGDKYELFYWADNNWKSLGKKTADNVMLDYDNCPTNALFLLHNHTKGSEERIFTYENGEQVWW